MMMSVKQRLIRIEMVTLSLLVSLSQFCVVDARTDTWLADERTSFEPTQLAESSARRLSLAYSSSSSSSSVSSRQQYHS